MIIRYLRSATHVLAPRSALLGLMSATVWAQAVNLLATPILARLYGPRAYGTYAFVFAIVSVASALVCGRLEWAVVLPRTEMRAKVVVSLAILSAFVTTIVAEAGLILLSSPIVDRYGQPTYHGLLWAPPMTFVLAAVAVLTQCSLRQQNFRVVSQQTAAGATSAIILQASASVFTRAGGGLLAGQTLGRAVAAIGLVRSNSRYIGLPRGWKSVLTEYWRFPVVFMPSSLLNVLGTNLPLLLITSVAGSASAGQLGLAQAIVLLPSTVIGTAVGQVFLARLGQSIREGRSDSRSQYVRATKRLSLIAFPVCLITVGLAPTVLPLILGAGWAPVGHFARAMAVSVAIGLVVSPLTFVFVAFQQTRLSLYVDVSRVVLVGGAGILAQKTGATSLQLVWLMYTGQAINYAVTWLIGLRIVSTRRGPTESPVVDTA